MNYLLFISVVVTLFQKHTCLKDPSKISDEEYYRLPEVFLLENYEKCLSQRDGVYCMGNFDLISTTLSPIYDTLLMLTKNTLINFNHTKIRRGLCLNGLSKCHANSSVPVHKSFEDCVNEDMFRQYGLQAKLSKLDYCKKRGDTRQLDQLDHLFIVYTVAIMFLNVTGTMFDILSNDRSKANSWLLSFSLRANWKKLIKIEENQSQFRCFHGMRAILSILVNIAHAALGLIVAYVPNTRYFEWASSRPEFVTFFNGTVVIQTFIVMSCFLRTIKTMNSESKNTFKVLLNTVIERFVRVSPLFMTVVALSATLIPYISDGPLWKEHIEDEAELCRTTFWRQFFFLQNFSPPSCVPQAWYLSVDFQLSIITTIITMYITKKRQNVKKIIISIFVTTILFVFIIAYAYELKPGLQMMKPETLITFFKDEISFLMMYQSVWGNLPSAIIGIVTALLFCHIKKNKYDLQRNKLFALLYRLSVPMCLIYLFIGGFMHTVTSRFAVSLYATLDKPGYGLIMAVFILGCIFKVDVLYRNIIEWQGWVILSRLSLGSLLLHGMINRVMVCNRLHPVNLSVLNVLAEGAAVSVFTFVLSIPLCLMVEYPFIELHKNVLCTGKQNSLEVEVNGCNNIKTKDE